MFLPSGSKLEGRKKKEEIRETLFFSFISINSKNSFLSVTVQERTDGRMCREAASL